MRRWSVVPLALIVLLPAWPLGAQAPSLVIYEVDVSGLVLQATGRSPLEEGVFEEGQAVGITIGFHVAHLLDLEGTHATH